MTNMLSSGAHARMERVGRPRHRRENQMLSEREVSESNPVELSVDFVAEFLDSASLRLE
jgi:hypothetical protein